MTIQAMGTGSPSLSVTSDVAAAVCVYSGEGLCIAGLWAPGDSIFLWLILWIQGPGLPRYLAAQVLLLAGVA